MKKPAKMTAAAALVLLGGAVALNCNSKRTDGNTPDGMLTLALTLPSGLTISQVNYTIHSAQPTAPPADKTGVINTGNGMAQPGVETSYPASTNDTVTLTATTSDGESCSGTSAAFPVLSNMQAMVSVTLTCGLLTPDGGPGSVRVNGNVVDQTDICPTLDSWSVSPLTTGPTGSIDLTSAASDGNAADSATLTYAWTSLPLAAGAFTNIAGGNATFTCPGSGNYTLTITVDDHHMPAHCTATRSVAVTCGACGNGVQDPGEQCDSAAQFMNNTCDPLTCMTIQTICGNNLVQPGETCDNAAARANNTCAPNGGVTITTPSGPQMIAGCQPIPVACGNGLVQPGETCEPPGTSSCDATCQTISPCIVCETTGTACTNTKVTPTSSFGCAGLTVNAPTSNAQCNTLHLCLAQHPNCSNPPGGPPVTNPLKCFCGNRDLATCTGTDQAMIDGDCSSAYFTIYGGRTNANRDAILGDMFNRTLPIGMANNLYTCDVNKSCFPVCSM
jgi:hypothetical protein